MTTAPHPTANAVPSPLLFNAWKHHAGWVRDRIAVAAGVGKEGVDELAGALVVVGTRTMDFYTGTLSGWAIGERLLELLRAAGTLDRPAFFQWVQASDGYEVVELPDDGSRWVLRAGDGERYVHLHPARRSPHTVRVTATTLKSAVLANALSLSRGLSRATRDMTDQARRLYLGLPSIGTVDDTPGLARFLHLLVPPSSPAVGG